MGLNESPVTRWSCATCSSGIYLESAAYPGYVGLKPSHEVGRPHFDSSNVIADRMGPQAAEG